MAKNIHLPNSKNNLVVSQNGQTDLINQADHFSKQSNHFGYPLKTYRVQSREKDSIFVFSFFHLEGLESDVKECKESVLRQKNTSIPEIKKDKKDGRLNQREKVKKKRTIEKIWENFDDSTFKLCFVTM